MGQISGVLSSRSLVAVVILFGLLFIQAAFYFIGLPWGRPETLTFYSISAMWTLGCAWTGRRTWRRVNKIDTCFVAFVFLIALSLGVSNLASGVDQRLWGFLLFMVVMPYLCGRCLVSTADLQKIQTLVLIAGLAIMPLLLVDRLMMPAVENRRFSFFGMDHSPLMAGALLSATLIAVHSWVFRLDISRGACHLPKKIAGYMLLFATTLCLVWVSARGWLFAGLTGAVTITLITPWVAPLKRILVLTSICLVALLSLKGLLRVDPSSGVLYARAGSSLAGSELLLGKAVPLLEKGVPVLGESSCEPFKGDNSVKIRLVLYQEAIAIFLQKPLLGVGVAAFGQHSCAGLGGFPHSTVLQVLAEMGLLGGVVFAALIALAGDTLIKRALYSNSGSKSGVISFYVALFVSVMLAGEIYWNVFMAVATYLLIGISAGMQGNEELRDKAHD